MDRVAAVALLRPDGAVLMQLRDDKPGLRSANMWVMPGGHSEPAEEIEATARREFLEETGYLLSELNFLIGFRDDEPDYPPLTVSVFWAVYDGVQPLECHEGQALEFLPRSDADRRSIPSVLLHAWDLALDTSRAAGALP